jgi:hypothetical protein
MKIFNTYEELSAIKDAEVVGMVDMQSHWLVTIKYKGITETVLVKNGDWLPN